jgi:3-hydroxybutyrate dehydrogenase
LARAFAKEGADIVINGFGEAAAIEKERSGIQTEFGVKCIYSPADMSKGDEVTGMIRLAEKEFGRVDILVNNAGIQHVEKLEDFPVATFETILRIMLTAPFVLTRAVLPGMYERGWGRVIHISSAHGRRASPYKAGYVSAKHGLEGLSKVIALEGAAHGVTSNCINPGYVRTPLVEAQIADQAAAHGMSEDEVLSKVILASSPVKRLIDPSEVATAAAFLCSPGSDSITGSDLVLDGGWGAR